MRCGPSCTERKLPTPWPVQCHNVFVANTLARPVTQAVCQDAQASELLLCFCVTDADDTVHVVVSTAGLSLLQFNKCIRAL
jgi:hypothetical protein